MFQFFLFTCKARIVIDSKFEECVIWQKNIKEVYNKTLHKRDKLAHKLANKLEELL